MASQTTKTTDPSVQITLSLLQDFFGAADVPPFAVRLWEGTIWQSKPEAAEPARFTLVLQHPGALRKMFLPPSELNLGEAYIYNDFDIEGDIEAVFPVADQIMDERWGKMAQVRYGKRLLSLPRTGQSRPGDTGARLRGALHSKERDKQAISYHYNRSNDFYALWLDQRMVYSCAYFASPDDDLDTAQQRKLEYICRKLRLRPGERLLDIGCGWGGLVPISTTLRIAEASGFEVRDVESLREHYALTLRHWVKRLEAHAEKARRSTNEVTYRIWRLYMAASIHAFKTGRTNIYQTLLAKADHGDSRLPLTRGDWYA
jgi:hypothetical protein